MPRISTQKYLLPDSVWPLIYDTHENCEKNWLQQYEVSGSVHNHPRVYGHLNLTLRTERI